MWRLSPLLVVLLFIVSCATPGPGAALGISLQYEQRGQDQASMAFVPAGPFIQGSTRAEVEYAYLLCKQHQREQCRRSWYRLEMPQSRVEVDAFWIDTYEVTNSQHQACVTAGACEVRDWETCTLWEQGWRAATPADQLEERFGSPQQPVVCVSWDDAQAYCAWAGKRLPTADEWEKAARGPAGWLFPWGNKDADCTHAWFDPHSEDKASPGCGQGTTAPVGSLPAGISPYGIYDAGGNVLEWVQDSEIEAFASGDGAPTGEQAHQARLVRGGSWASDPSVLRPSSRGGFTPDQRNIYTGFRCAVQ
ncbi:MAG: formylglycine-generating enzyme family protein [Myxococcota bacterium]